MSEEEENSTKVISAASLSHSCSSGNRNSEGERMSVSVGMWERGWGGERWGRAGLRVAKQRKMKQMSPMIDHYPYLPNRVDDMHRVPRECTSSQVEYSGGGWWDRDKRGYKHLPEALVTQKVKSKRTSAWYLSHPKLCCMLGVVGQYIDTY